MTEKDKLILEIMGLAYLVQRETEYAVFIDYSGHVDRLEIEIVESADRYQNKLSSASFYPNKLDWYTDDPLAWLKVKRDHLTHIIEHGEIDTGAMEAIVEQTVSYVF